MTKVVSLALFKPAFGEHRHHDALEYFVRYIPVVLRAYAAVFPGWRVVIHHDDSIHSCHYGSTLKLLAARGLVELRYCGPVAALTQAMLWRMLPVIEGNASHVICRDLDSLPMPRERRAVEEWAGSGKCMHIMHDHQNHSNPGSRAFIPGGLCGFVPSLFRALTGITDLMQMLEWGHTRHIGFHAKGDDQTVLNGMLPPLIGDSYMLHPWSAETGHTVVTPRELPDVDNRILSVGDTLADYTGGVFNIDSVWRILGPLPTSRDINRTEQDIANGMQP